MIAIRSKSKLIFSQRKSVSSLGFSFRKLRMSSAVNSADGGGGDEGVALTVSPPHCLMDEPVSISVAGLSPGQCFTLQASVTDCKGVPFNTLAHYRSSKSGTIELAQQPALGGHFDGIFPMGLISNLVPTKEENKTHRFSYKNVTKPFDFTLSVYPGAVAPYIAKGLAMSLGLEPLCSTQHQRFLLGPGCRRVPVRHGRVRGVMHLPAGPGPFPGVIDMFGSNGGLMEQRSALLAARGVAALSLAFFAYEDLPVDMSDGFEMSYFQEAVDYLMSLDEVCKERGVGAVGTSKGGDLVLNMAAHIPDVTATVCINGHICNVESKLTLTDGSIVPAFTFDLTRIKLLSDGTIDCLNLLDDPLDHPSTIVPLERIQGDVLMLVGQDDKNWKSESFADLAMERFGHSGRLQVVKYPGAGHLIEPPYVPFCCSSYHRVVRGSMLFGGLPLQHCEAQVDSWHRMINFFKEKLCPAAAGTVSKL